MESLEKRRKITMTIQKTEPTRTRRSKMMAIAYEKAKKALHWGYLHIQLGLNTYTSNDQNKLKASEELAQLKGPNKLAQDSWEKQGQLIKKAKTSEQARDLLCSKEITHPEHQVELIQLLTPEDAEVVLKLRNQVGQPFISGNERSALQVKSRVLQSKGGEQEIGV
jgi:hypothetical protein